MSSVNLQIPSEDAFPEWGIWTLDPAQRTALQFIVFYGGRSAGKSWAIARLLVWLAATQVLRVLCLRETQRSMSETSKSTLEGAIIDMGLSGIYTSTINSIKCANGSVFLFHGLGKTTESRLRSMHAIDIAFIEEAQEVSEGSWRSLLPTIIGRKESAQIWIAFNPASHNDIVYRLFVSNPNPPPRSKVIKVTYEDNPWTSDATRQLVEHERETNFDWYRHDWLGELLPDAGLRRVLPIERLRKCVKAFNDHKDLIYNSRTDVGLDVADTGTDRNALAVRRGPGVTHIETWRGTELLRKTSLRADRMAVAENANSLFFDEAGPGAGVRSDLITLGRRPYYIRPVKFGSAPAEPDKKFDGTQSNREAFALRNAQMAWALYLRAENTERLLNGEDVDPRKCLFIKPELLETRDASNLLDVLNQPTWDDGDGGRIKIAKAQEDESSPDMYDAVALAFCEDSRRGLRIGLN